MTNYICVNLTVKIAVLQYFRKIETYEDIFKDVFWVPDATPGPLQEGLGGVTPPGKGSVVTLASSS